MLPERLKNHGPQVSALPGVTVLEHAQLTAETFTEAGIASARAARPGRAGRHRELPRRAARPGAEPGPAPGGRRVQPPARRAHPRLLPRLHGAVGQRGGGAVVRRRGARRAGAQPCPGIRAHAVRGEAPGRSPRARGLRPRGARRPGRHHPADRAGRAARRPRQPGARGRGRDAPRSAGQAAAPGAHRLRDRAQARVEQVRPDLPGAVAGHDRRVHPVAAGSQVLGHRRGLPDDHGHDRFRAYPGLARRAGEGVAGDPHRRTAWRCSRS